MSTQVQYRRGTNAQNDAFTGALAEITVDTTNKTLRVHDGLTAGGFALVGTTATQTLTNKTLSSVTITGTVTGNIIPAANVTYNLGNTTNRFNDLWLANSTIYLGGAQISANSTSLILTNPGGGTTVLAGASAEISATSVSASGNITGNYILGNGSLLTGIDATSIQSGTSNVRVVSSGGNISVGVGGTSNVAVWATTGEYVTGIVSATGNITGGNLSGTNIVGTLATAAQTNVTSVGTLTNLNSGTISSSGNVTGANILTGGIVSATGNITGGNISATNHTGTTVSVTGTVTSASVVGGVITGTSVSVSGAVTGGAITGSSLNITTGTANVGSITNANANGVGNIGNSTVYFNTVFAKATSAQYADVAEKYVADRQYPPGTVLEIGGAAEVQETTTYASSRIAGVVSTTPALLMNSAESNANSVEIALLGRVPCRVTGTIHRGDLLTSSDRPGVATALRSGDYRPGCVLGKALEAHATAGDGIIEVLVGRI